MLCLIKFVKWIKGGISVIKMTTKNKPKRDGSGKGIRKNKGRGGCKKTKIKGKGRDDLKRGKNV